VDVPADRRPAMAAAGAGRQAAGGEPGAGDWPGCIRNGSPAAFAGRNAFLSAVLTASTMQAKHPFALRSADQVLACPGGRWVNGRHGRLCCHARGGGIDAAASRDGCRREDRFGLPRLAGDRCPDRGKDVEVLVYAGG